MSSEDAARLAAMSASRNVEDGLIGAGKDEGTSKAAASPLPTPLPTPVGVTFDVAVDEGEDDDNASLIDLDLAADNLGEGKGCCPCGVRSLVSKKKKRFISPAEGVDLDLSYITNRVIAMGYPSVGLEALYRNPSDKVRAFLESRHGAQQQSGQGGGQGPRYRLYNLCCEREYAVTELFGRGVEVERFAWADHTPPPAAMVLPCMESMDSWLNANPTNVVVIHCKVRKLLIELAFFD